MIELINYIQRERKYINNNNIYRSINENFNDENWCLLDIQLFIMFS